MPESIQVGPPVLTINQSSTFMVTDLNGEIVTEGEYGIFAGDTRFVNYYAIFANGESWQRLASSATTYNAARIHLTNPAVPLDEGEIPAGTQMLTVTRTVEDGIHEDLAITNYCLGPVSFNLEIAIRSDFADIFEVRWHKFVRRGYVRTVWDEETCELHTSYTNQDFIRRCIYRIVHSDTRPHYANGRITFAITLPPSRTWRACCAYLLVQGDQVRAPEHTAHGADVDAGSTAEQLQQRWMASATTLTSSNEDWYRLFRQGVEDMGALRLTDYDFAPDVWLPAAGVPWFVTIFGRDSLIVSLQTLMVHPGLALGALRKLAQFQATERDDWRDAEPGKIPHELRFGELAHFRRIPHTPYYGTADATSLYLIALHETWKWRGDDDLLRRYRDVALRCLDWIDQDGDLDGDGFQEYRSRSPLGYEDVCWKDAGDAIVYPDGTMVRQPKALCELQGYVFDAWLRMAEVFDALGEPDRATKLRARAADLQARFEAAFWCEEAGTYAFTLDPDKRPVPTVASNAGHCLWSGIATPEHAARVVRRLMEPDMWSGWGIRTLSARNPAYNPLSYQRGSVWPHDNGIIALGFRRYGFAAEAARIARDISEAASHFVLHRLPELYGGVERRPGTFPVLYPTANVPQAWAAGTVFHLVQAILGLQADAPNGKLYVDPALPPWLRDLTLRGIRVGNARLDLRFWREGERSYWVLLNREGEITVEQKSWQPWAVPVT